MNMPQDDEILRTGVALLVFVIAFYALVARERKTPDIVHAVYRVAFLVLGALVAALTANLLQRTTSGTPATPTPPPPEITTWLVRLRWSSVLLLGGALFYILYRLWRDQNRQIFFRDDQLLWNTPLGRLWTFAGVKLRKLKKEKRYETNPMSLPEALISSLRSSKHIGSDRVERAVAHHKASPNLSISAVFEIHNLVDIDSLLTDLATRFLENDCFVQYTSCTRHPIEFLMQLESSWRQTEKREHWNNVQNRIVVVDAYTPHFGFTDTIYWERTEEAKRHCLAFVKSTRTYAGVHTAIAKAFNKIKRAEKRTAPRREVRTPTLVIYEGCSALIDLESNEQYRIFVRHVLPSERLWGGMFTVFVEPDIAEENRAALEGATDIFVQVSVTSDTLKAASGHSE